MTTVTVWRFEEFDAEHLIKGLDHAVRSGRGVVSRRDGKRTLDAARHRTGCGALWGRLADGPFRMPLFAASGATKSTDAVRNLQPPTFATDECSH